MRNRSRCQPSAHRLQVFDLKPEALGTVPCSDLEVRHSLRAQKGCQPWSILGLRVRYPLCQQIQART